MKYLYEDELCLKQVNCLRWLEQRSNFWLKEIQRKKLVKFRSNDSLCDYDIFDTDFYNLNIERRSDHPICSKIFQEYTQPVITCSKLATETLEQDLKYLQS